MFQHLVPSRITATLTVALAAILFSCATLAADPPDLPFPEDVLRPESGDYPAFFLVPYLGINRSFLLSSAIRSLNEESLGEISNGVIDEGGGFGFELGLDLLYRPVELFGIRGGVGFHRRAFGSSGSALAQCTIEIPGTGTTTESEEEVNMSYCVVADYLDLHLVGEFYFGDAFVSLGYGLGIPTRMTYEETDEIADTANACVYLRQTEAATKRVSGRAAIADDLQSLRHSLRVGGGYAWELTDDIEWLLRLEYDHPFTDLYSGAPEGVLVNQEVENSPGYDIPLDEGVRVGTLSLDAALRIRL